VVAAIGSETLPEAFRDKTLREKEALWPGWVAGRDAEVRARLAQGSEDSLVNFMLFGTSFTKQPRATLKDLGAPTPTQTTHVRTRIRDLARALAAPGANERLVFARELVKANGLDPAAAGDRSRVEEYIAASLARVVKENADHAKTLEAARLLRDSTAEFAQRSRLFSNRGLSSDTSLLPNWAIEESLQALKERGLVETGKVTRVAVIGPGLDFTDKQDGYDFYPQQTIQPFAVMDSLLRLGLARVQDLRVVTFDLSPQVNDHLSRVVRAAVAGRGYVVQLPRDPSSPWKPGAVAYWEHFGDRIGSSTRAIAPPAGAGAVQTRAVRIRPDVVSRVEARDLNVVLQKQTLGHEDRFDLVIATNVLVYYDVFEQSLALLNIASMTRPGGFLLSNNAVLELPRSPMRSAGYRTTIYSDRENDGDHIVWYRRLLE
jgi:hypothetical protein